MRAGRLCLDDLGRSRLTVNPDCNWRLYTNTIPAGNLMIGRPSEMDGGKAVKVYLDAESIAIATRLGNGNVSEGIRKALKQAGENAPW